MLKGDGGSPGIVRGRARIVLDPADARGLKPGDILVAPLTDPAWTPLFLPAAAVVVNVGALMSHAVIVSRELGIPCVVAIAGATRADRRRRDARGGRHGGNGDGAGGPDRLLPLQISAALSQHGYRAKRTLPAGVTS